MERRTFIRNSSLAAASLILPQSLKAETGVEEQVVTSNPDSLLALEDKPLRRIAFGSCNRSTRDMRYWSLVKRDEPDLWIWMGDNIYADLTTLKQRESLYNNLKAYPLYQDFRASTAVIGTWDDHDYGFNNIGGSFWNREESQKLFCDFMDIPKASEIRVQDGIYQSYSFGPAGQRTQVILLDLRYNMNNSPSRRTILGEAQWRWFENELKNSTADLIVIGSSLNVTSNATGFGMEGWGAYPEERKRLYDALAAFDMPVVMLSGDRHYAELYRIALPSGRVVHEAMSSGLTHAIGVDLPHPGRISPVIGVKNYGVLEIDWSGGRPVVAMQIKSAETYGLLFEARTQDQL